MAQAQDQGPNVPLIELDGTDRGREQEGSRTDSQAGSLSRAGRELRDRVEGMHMTELLRPASETRRVEGRQAAGSARNQNMRLCCFRLAEQSPLCLWRSLGHLPCLLPAFRVSSLSAFDKQ